MCGQLRLFRLVQLASPSVIDGRSVNSAVLCVAGVKRLNSDLRAQLLKIGKAGISAADPATAIQAAIQVDQTAIHIENDHLLWDDLDRVIVLGAGKASARMAQELEHLLGPRTCEGLVIVKDGYGVATQTVEVVEAAHPRPDARGERASRRLLAMAQEAGPRDLIIFCVSGGGSCLTPATLPGVSLGALQYLTDQLLRCGATINQINAVRKHLSLIHGGRLAAAAHPARVVALILSDVVGNPLDVIASGPTVADPTTYIDALQTIDAYELRATVPESIRTHLERGESGAEAESPKPGDARLDAVRNVVIADNSRAAAAAAHAARNGGFDALHVTSFMEGEAKEIGRAIAGTARDIAANDRPVARPGCAVFGGETTVTVRGKGRGGRSQEMALAAALALRGHERAGVITLATDGSDGPTNAAGGIVDGKSVDRARAAGIDAGQALANNDSHSFLEAAGDLIVTGPTHTNVNDLYIAVGW